MFTGEDFWHFYWALQKFQKFNWNKGEVASTIRENWFTLLLPWETAVRV